MRKIDSIEIKLAEHCNQKCTGCGTFANLAEQNFYDFNWYCKDLRRLKDIFESIGIIRLFGGEPLLNKEINKYIEVTKQICPESSIEIITNGILLSSMSDEFFECVKENNALIKISKYPNIDENIYPLRKMDLLHVKYQVNKYDKFYVKFSAKEENPEDSYSNCCVPISLYLDKGKIFQCPYMQSIKYYDSKYNTNWEKDVSYIDIYTNNAQEIIYQIMKAPVFCKHCKVKTGFVKCEQGNPKRENWNFEDDNDKLVKDFDYYDFLKQFKEISFGMIKIQNNFFDIIKIKAEDLKNLKVTILKFDEKDTVVMELVTKAAEIVGFTVDSIITLEELGKIPKDVECNILYRKPANHLLNVYGNHHNMITKKLMNNKFFMKRSDD